MSISETRATRKSTAGSVSEIYSTEQESKHAKTDNQKGNPEFDLDALLKGTTWENKFNSKGDSKNKIADSYEIEDVCFMEWDDSDPTVFVVQYRDQELDEKFSEGNSPGKYGVFYKNETDGKFFSREEISVLLQKFKKSKPSGLLGLILQTKL
eukprot:gb/GEZN01025355.1/.p1 GENE.gb/GEZN01025355.1/~~gb/GEZN01025355.1/.p1  ORF type:complete len:153 (-),score=24.03 gb/GEZN01025355.1/:65-523(-)